MERGKRLAIMIETAFMAALSFILGFLEFGGPWLAGGSISFIMVPIFLMAFRRGWKAGIATGFLAGMLQLLQGATIVHPVQLVLEYPIAYTVLGFAAIFTTHAVFRERIPYLLMLIGIVFGALLRYIDHFVSGVIWFGSYAPEGTPVVTYSALYNASYLIPQTIITVIILFVIAKYRPKFFDQPKWK